VPDGIPFDRVAAIYDATRGGDERARTTARDVAAHLPAGDVLELGVGTGIVARALLDVAHGARRLTGVDLSAEMLARAAPRLPGAVVRASALRLPFPAHAFDGILAVHVLHLIPDVDAALAEAARVLRPGGRLVAVHAGPRVVDATGADAPDDLTDATAGLRRLRPPRRDSAVVVAAAAADAGLAVVSQHQDTPLRTSQSPAELADLIERRTWSYLWDLDDDTWRAEVEPVVAALRALPDAGRSRVHFSTRTVTVLTPRTESA